jgi:hypothetical protein
MDAATVALLIKAGVDAIVALIAAGADHTEVLARIAHIEDAAQKLRADVDDAASGH